jgi:hypothetical protein
MARERDASPSLRDAALRELQRRIAEAKEAGSSSEQESLGFGRDGRWAWMNANRVSTLTISSLTGWGSFKTLERPSPLPSIRHTTCWGCMRLLLLLGDAIRVAG